MRENTADGPKICSSCRKVKSRSDFQKRSRSADGLMSACRVCCQTRNADYRHRNHELLRQRDRDRRAADPELFRSRQRDRYRADPRKKLDANKAWKQANPAKMVEMWRRGQLRRYGLSEADYAALLEANGPLCPICGQAPARGGKPTPLVVDHCHRTNKIRGLLCWRCNGALGIIGEENLMRFVEYLRVHEAGGWPGVR